MIKSVIFDFGNVIANFSQEEFIKKHNPKSLSLAEFQKLIFHNWPALDNGDIELDDYIQQALALAPKKAHQELINFFNEWTQYFEYNQPIYDLIKELETKDIDLYLLSNAPRFFAESLSKFEVLDNFKGFVISGVEKVSKPDEAIYQILLDRFNIDPKHALFIDDLEDNVKAAIDLGIKSIRYVDDTQAIKALLFNK